MSEQNLKKYIAELIQEVEKELEEATTTANVDGYQTPHAFSRKKDKERTRKNATQLGYELVDDDVDNITEAGLKGTENIPSNKKLSQLSDTDKLKIVQGTGNLISFKIPSWSKDKKWTVISSGKIVKKKNLNGETIFFLQGKGGIIKASPTYPSVKELLDGVNWDTMELRRESVNEARIKRPVNRWLELKNDETMHPHKKMAHGLKELKYQLAETEKFFTWYNKIKTMNELDSTNYWKRTQNHIYKIKERLINIAKTLQEIEK